MATNSTKAPILDLNTLIDRPHIDIDGKPYELLAPEELSIADSHWFSVKGEAIEKHGREDDHDALETVVSEVSRRCLVDCPDEVFDRLSGPDRMAISEVFTRLLLQRKTRQAGAIARMVLNNQSRKQTGAKSSLGSSVSSAAIRSGGSSKPRQHS